MKEAIALLISKQIPLKKEEILALIEIPPTPDLGDYAFPCFSLAKIIRKNPVEIAKDLARDLSPNEKFEKISAVGPYVNFFIDKKSFSINVIKGIQQQKNKFGSSKSGKEKIMVEFSQANTHKAFHIGHVRGTSLGESLSRILEFTGNKVIRANYQGDIGMHVAKWLWCYEKYHKKEKLRKDEAWIASIYVDAVKRLAEKPELQDQVDIVNRKLDEKSDKNLNDLWKKTRKLSLDAFEKIYHELNTEFNNYFFESELEEKSKEICQELLKKSIATISDGATIINLEKDNLGVWVLLRRDGTVLYSAKDLALAEKKFNKLKIDKSIYIVGAAQTLHMNQLFKTLEMMNFNQASKCEFIPVTEVRLPTGKMSSRTGENILYSSFLAELKEYSKSEIKKREKLSEKELEKRALAISIASLKYAMLKQDPNKTITFSKEEALAFEGNTGPYLLYSYARARSILKKSKNKAHKLNIKSINEKEKELIVKLSKFPEVISSAAQNLSPNDIANYAYELSKSFNEFYHSSQVIGSDEEDFRLVLVDSFSQVLKNSLFLLGIPVLESM